MVHHVLLAAVEGEVEFGVVEEGDVPLAEEAVLDIVGFEKEDCVGAGGFVGLGGLGRGGVGWVSVWIEWFSADLGSGNRCV